MPRAGLTTERVVDHAAALADRDGLAALTLARLAADLGIRVPSLYKHVDGLPDLHRRLAVLASTGMADAIRTATVGLAGADALRACCRAYRAFALRYPGRYTAAQRAVDPKNPDDAEAGRRATELTELVLSVLRSYGLAADDSIHAARILRSSIHGFASLELLAGFGMPTSVDESFEQLLDVLDSGIRTMAAKDQVVG